MNCGIYRIENLVNSKCYIGQSINLSHRKSVHFCYLDSNKEDNRHLQSSYNKYGKDNFKFTILLFCEVFELTRYELLLDAHYKRLNLSYNIRDCANSNKGRVFSTETRMKISKAISGKRLSEETKRKISRNRKGKGIGRSSGMLGKHPSEITKQKISISQKGKVRSEETRMKMSKAKKGKPSSLKGIPRSEETKRKIGEGHKGISHVTSKETRDKIGESVKRYYQNRLAR